MSIDFHHENLYLVIVSFSSVKKNTLLVKEYSNESHFHGLPNIMKNTIVFEGYHLMEM